MGKIKVVVIIIGILSKNPHICTNHIYDRHILLHITFSKNSEIVQFLTKIKYDTLKNNENIILRLKSSSISTIINDLKFNRCNLLYIKFFLFYILCRIIVQR